MGDGFSFNTKVFFPPFFLILKVKEIKAKNNYLILQIGTFTFALSSFSLLITTTHLTTSLKNHLEMKNINPNYI